MAPPHTHLTRSRPGPAELVAALREVHWTPQTSGTQVPEPAATALERLWAEYGGAVRGAPKEDPVPVPSGQGRRIETALRAEIEDLAQERLSALFEARGWGVEDRRFGNPLDAGAARGAEVVNLEAKGTTSAEESVIVTRGEVRFAREHPGSCATGIVAHIAVGPDGHVDPASGTLQVLDWSPRDEDLEPRAHDFFPPR